MKTITLDSKEYTLLTGDLISTKVKVMPLVIHFGIIMIDNDNIFVLHNTPFKGSVIESLDDFLSTRTLYEIEPTELNNYSLDSIYQRFTFTCKKGYHLLAYNCEHFIDCMLYRDQKSEQVKRWGRRLLVAFAVYKIGKGYKA